MAKKKTDIMVDENTKVESTKQDSVKPTTGVVNNCEQLNVRKSNSASSEIITVIDAGTNVEIDPVYKDSIFYKIKTGKISGYCMKEYIKFK